MVIMHINLFALSMRIYTPVFFRTGYGQTCFFFFYILFTEFNLAFGPLMESLLICLGSRLRQFNKEEFKSNALHVVTCSSFCKWLICTKTYLLCQCEYVHIPLCFDNGRYTQVFFRFENALDMHKHVTMWEG